MAPRVSFAFLLTILVDYPFSGDESVSTDAYKGAVLAQFPAGEDGGAQAPVYLGAIRRAPSRRMTSAFR